MLQSIISALQDISNKRIKKKHLPKAAPSTDDAILPFDPAEYSISPQRLKR